MTEGEPTDLLDRLATREARVGMIGLGYVGLPLTVEFAEAGFTVRGYDIDSERVQRLRDGDSYVNDVTDNELQEALASRFTPRNQPATVEACDVYVIAVPTGVRQGEPQMDAVRAASQTVGEQCGDRETLVVVASTVYPGATEEVVKPAVTSQPSPSTDSTHLAMVPERINPGGEYDAAEIPLVIGGDTEPARRNARELFDSIVVDTHPVSSTTTAELTKTLENTYRMVNIALVNEIAKLSEEMGTNIWEAIEAASTKPFGFHAFRPGPGVGGHCIPVDPQFISWQGHNYGRPLTLVENAHRTNESMPIHIIDRFRTTLAAHNLELEEASVLALGVAYKPNIGDVRNSPARVVCEQLVNKCTTVETVDPHVESVSLGGDVYEPKNSVPKNKLQTFDAAIILVNHDAFEYTPLRQVQIVFDNQNAVPDSLGTTVVSLGKNHWSWRNGSKDCLQEK